MLGAEVISRITASIGLLRGPIRSHRSGAGRACLADRRTATKLGPISSRLHLSAGPGQHGMFPVRYPAQHILSWPIAHQMCLGTGLQLNF